MFCPCPQRFAFSCNGILSLLVLTVFLLCSTPVQSAAPEDMFYNSHKKTDLFSELRNPCISFRDVQQHENDFAVKRVKILGTDDSGKTAVIILGAYRSLDAVIDGISLNEHRSNVRYIICNGKMSGSVVWYDIAKSGMKKGNMKVSADGISDELNVNMSPHS